MKVRDLIELLREIENMDEIMDFDVIVGEEGSLIDDIDYRRDVSPYCIYSDPEHEEFVIGILSDVNPPPSIKYADKLYPPEEE